METKKNFVMPEIDIVHFDVQDVITASGGTASLFEGIYDVKGGWRDF